LIQKNSPSIPAWCELEHYELVALAPGASYHFAAAGRKQKLIVGQGRCRIAYGGQALLAEEGTNLDLPADDGSFEVTETLDDAVLVYLAGRWGDEVGGSGLFSVRKSVAPQDSGDPVSYAKETNFDRHYHDMDEYWIVFQGGASPFPRGNTTKSAQATALPPAWATTMTFPWSLSGCGRYFLKRRWRAANAAATCGSIHMGRRSPSWIVFSCGILTLPFWHSVGAR
jgi:hypothetical protein